MAEPFDGTTKSFYRSYFLALRLGVYLNAAIFSRERSIDIVVVRTGAESPSLLGTLFDFFRLINAVELKGPMDPLDLQDLNLILMRAWGLGAMPAESELSIVASGALATEEARRLPSNRTVTILCVVRPDHILDDLGVELGFSPTEVPGIYINSDSLRCRIIVPSELPLERRYYPALPLSKGARLEQFIERCIDERETEFLQMALDVGLVSDPEAVWRKIMGGMMTTGFAPETIEFLNRKFEENPEIVRMLPYLRQTIDDAADSARKEADARAEAAQREADARAEAAQREADARAEAAQREADARAEAAQREAARAAAARQEAEATAAAAELTVRRDDLTRLLTRKFGDLPSPVTARIESTVDAARLREWFDRALDASSLEDALL